MQDRCSEKGRRRTKQTRALLKDVQGSPQRTYESAKFFRGAKRSEFSEPAQELSLNRVPGKRTNCLPVDNVVIQAATTSYPLGHYLNRTAISHREEDLNNLTTRLRALETRL